MKKRTIWLIIGIVLFLIGSVVNSTYEEDGITVAATITDVKTTEDTDSDGLFRGYKHTYYGTYTIGGKTYTGQKLKTSRTDGSSPNYPRGSTIDVVVSEDGQVLPEGGILITVGFIIAVYNGYRMIRDKKNAKATS